MKLLRLIVIVIVISLLLSMVSMGPSFFGFGSSRTVENGVQRIQALAEYFKSQKYDEIIRIFDASKPLTVDEKLLAAKSFDRIGAYRKSNGLLRQLLLQETGLRYFCFYLIARNFEKAGQYDRAIRWYNKTLSEIRKSPIPDFDHAAIAKAALSRLYFLGASLERALKSLHRYKRYMPAANYYLALLYQLYGDYKKSADFYYKILSAGKEAYVQQALRELLKDRAIILHLHKKGFGYATLMNFFMDSGLYEEALDLSYLFKEEEWLFLKRAICYYRLGDFEAASKAYEHYYKLSGDNEALLRIAFAYFYMGNYDRSRYYLQKFLTTSSSQPRKSVDDQTQAASVVSLRLQLDKRTASTEQYLESARRFINRIKGDPQIDQLIGSSFYHALVNNNSKQAVYFLLSVYPFLKNSAYKAWASYVLGIYHDESKLLQTLRFHPGSFYYFRASDILNSTKSKVRHKRNEVLTEAEVYYNSGNFEDALSQYILLYSGKFNKKYVKERIKDILRVTNEEGDLCDIETMKSGLLYKFYSLGFYEELEEIIHSDLLFSDRKSQMRYYFLLSKVYYEKGDIYGGISYAENMMKGLDQQYILFFSDEILKLLYPPAYRDIIELELSQEPREYDALFVLSVIREESRYNAHAKSSKGALGLMQLMPDTASWIMKKQIVEEELYDPATNISTGMEFLDYLFRRFDRIEYVIAAYNGGPKNAAKWIRNTSGGSIERFIEEIPFPETRNFVKKVFTTYKLYGELYNFH